MSSAGASSPIFHAEWQDYPGCYRVFDPRYSYFTIAIIWQVYIPGSNPWSFESINWYDDFRPDVIFDDGPLAGDVMLSGELIHRNGGPQAAEHSYPLDITVLTDTDDDLPF